MLPALPARGKMGAAAVKIRGIFAVYPRSFHSTVFRPQQQQEQQLERVVMSRPPPSYAPAPEIPASRIPIFTTLAALRDWRMQAFKEGKTVGFVPTMGALHHGHLSLGARFDFMEYTAVEWHIIYIFIGTRSLEANDYTVFSIFVNPAQFAPHEDLATYPRTLKSDLELIESLPLPFPSAPSPVLFLPSVKEMYPLGIEQNVAKQKGTFVEVCGYGHQMEGKSRPTFFRGVATVVTKLFNAVLVRPFHFTIHIAPVNYVTYTHTYIHIPSELFSCLTNPN
jgi:hypothetical protein